jgi:hypothetical protein|tara:strand:+ start:70 stop:570 length:501 start_codon:yes stop_codon:yes gene_type:complete
MAEVMTKDTALEKELKELSTSLAKMTKMQLAKYANEKGWTVDPNLAKEVLIDRMVEAERNVRQAAADQTAETTEKMATKDDPAISVKFINVESPGADVAFDYEGGKYHLYHNQTCELPKSVVRHLNSLVVPDNKYEIDPATQQIKGVVEGVKNRFTVLPTDLIAQL